MKLWRAEPEWLGETVYIIAGGPSVAEQDIDLLRGRRVIAINSSYTVAPWADILFFADPEWAKWHAEQIRFFGGRIVTTAKSAKQTSSRYLYMEKVVPPPSLTADRGKLVLERTSLQGAINLAVHFGVARIVLLGADMTKASDGRCHHHAPHPSPLKPNCFDEQMVQLVELAKPLAELGIDVINCSPVSRIDWWPNADLGDTL